MKFLLKTVETYRVDTEAEATQLIEEAKKKFTVSKAISEKKSRKAKGEIIDEWVRVTITKEFTEEKEPDDVVSVNYKSEGYFPQPSQEVEDVDSED